MKRLIASIIVVLIFIYCKGDDKNYDLKSIEVYSVPFGINFPVNVGESAVNEAKPHLIEEEIVLNQIEAYIHNLQKSKSPYKSDEIYLRCKLNAKDGNVIVMDYNKSLIKLNGEWYRNYPDLIELILNSKAEDNFE